MQGYIHQLESFGCADGPGSRFIIFFAGCPLRCLYCHNPDTWENSQNQKISVDEILNKFNSVKEFLKNGGLTVTGGEPLVQIDFVIELFKSAKEKNIMVVLEDFDGNTAPFATAKQLTYFYKNIPVLS